MDLAASTPDQVTYPLVRIHGLPPDTQVFGQLGPMDTSKFRGRGCRVSSSAQYSTRFRWKHSLAVPGNANRTLALSPCFPHRCVRETWTCRTKFPVTCGLATQPVVATRCCRTVARDLSRGSQMRLEHSHGSRWCPGPPFATAFLGAV